MSIIHFEQQPIPMKEHQTVLDALLENGHEIPNSCRAGACQACLMQATEGTPPDSAQKGLKDTLRADGFFLACQCQPDQEMTVTLDPSRSRIQASIVSTELLAKDVLRVRVVAQAPMSYHSGQYVTLWRDQTTARSYSLASVPEIDGDSVELQVKRMPNGAMSEWLFEQASSGVTVELQGPMGNCFYLPGEADGALLLVATGTGLAPIYGIARDALAQGHSGPIHLIHGALDCEGLYLHEELSGISDAHDNFYYHASALQGAEERDDISSTPLEALALSIAGGIDNPRAYLCGAPELVNTLRKKLFLAGLGLSRIYADAFLPGNAKG